MRFGISAGPCTLTRALSFGTSYENICHRVVLKIKSAANGGIVMAIMGIIIWSQLPRRSDEAQA